MMKSIFAMLFLCTMAVGATVVSSAPVSAAPAAVTAPQTGSCQYYCGNSTTPFRTAAACQAACSTFCEAVC